MFLKKSLKIVASTFLILLVSKNISAFAAAYAGEDNGLTNSYNISRTVLSAYSTKGWATYDDYNNFTPSTLDQDLPVVNPVFIMAHGVVDSNGSYLDEIATSNHSVYYSSDHAYQITRGAYDVVVMYSCYSGNNDCWYKAFNMYEGYAGNHALVGFNGPTYQTGPSYNFVTDIYNNLKAGQNINSAVWNARVDTGITNYVLMGSGDATL